MRVIAENIYQPFADEPERKPDEWPDSFVSLVDHREVRVQLDELRARIENFEDDADMWTGAVFGELKGETDDQEAYNLLRATFASAIMSAYHIARKVGHETILTVSASSPTVQVYDGDVCVGTLRAISIHAQEDDNEAWIDIRLPLSSYSVESAFE